MRIITKFAALLLALTLCCAMALPALAAHPVPDLDRACSVTVTLQDGNKTVSGGEFTITQVGKVKESNGDYSFVPASDFTKHKADFKDISDKSLPKDLAKTAKSAKTKPADTEKSVKGQVKFTDLKPGLYLIQNTKACTGYQLGDPFLVSLPYLNKEKTAYLYDLNATVKQALERELEPTKPSGNLPQTGQLNWPIPAMAMLGLTFIVAGVALRRGKKDDA